MFVFQRARGKQDHMILHDSIQQTVHVSCTPVNGLDDRFIETLRPVLSDWELRRLDSFTFEEDRVRFAVAHALVRVTLSRLHPVAPVEWRFHRTDVGKPFVSAPRATKPIHFSLSHTRGLVGCATAVGTAVGFDLEILDDKLDVCELLPLVMARAEMAHWANNAREAPTRRFLCHWTLKEALAKALGVGMTVAPTSLVFEVGNTSDPKVVGLPPELGAADEWKMYLKDLLGTHISAVAVNAAASQSVDMRWGWMKTNELILALSGFEGISVP